MASTERLLILDNYDSFTYNLSHLVGKVSDISMDVIRNDKISVEEVRSYSRIILSPGPGLPKDAGIMPELIRTYAQTKPILGVCLGMQAIGENFGAKLKNLETVFHGIATPIKTTEPDFLFKDCPQEFKVGRYHSWVLDPNNFSDELDILAEDEEKNIMAVRHKKLNIRGVQFHPESILSEFGEKILSNWLAQS